MPRPVLLLLVAAVTIIPGCLVEDGDCPRGSRGCACDQGYCRSQLACRDGVCVEADGDGEVAEQEAESESDASSDCHGRAGMALVAYQQTEPFCIDRYEASRADATAASPGADTTSAPRSAAGVLPWPAATFSQARTACVAAGKRLCTLSEWQRACAFPEGCRHPYPADTDCSGFDASRCVVYTGAAMPAGSRSGCESRSGLFDLEGNLYEWTDEANPLSPVQHRVTGGSYAESNAFFLACDQGRFLPDTFIGLDVGFRCCADPP